MFLHQEREGKNTTVLKICKHLSIFFINSCFQQRTLLVKAGANVRVFFIRASICEIYFRTFLYMPDYQHGLRRTARDLQRLTIEELTALRHESRRVGAHLLRRYRSLKPRKSFFEHLSLHRPER